MLSQDAWAAALQMAPYIQGRVRSLNPDQREDVEQNCYLRLARVWANYDPKRGSWFGYAYRHVVAEIQDHCRKRRFGRRPMSFSEVRQKPSRHPIVKWDERPPIEGHACARPAPRCSGCQRALRRRSERPYDKTLEARRHDATTCDACHKRAIRRVKRMREAS